MDERMAKLRKVLETGQSLSQEQALELGLGWRLSAMIHSLKKHKDVVIVTERIPGGKGAVRYSMVPK